MHLFSESQNLNGLADLHILDTNQSLIRTTNHLLGMDHSALFLVEDTLSHDKDNICHITQTNWCNTVE